MEALSVAGVLLYLANFQSVLQIFIHLRSFANLTPVIPPDGCPLQVWLPKMKSEAMDWEFHLGGL